MIVEIQLATSLSRSWCCTCRLCVITLLIEWTYQWTSHNVCSKKAFICWTWTLVAVLLKPVLEHVRFIVTTSPSACFALAVMATTQLYYSTQTSCKRFRVHICGALRAGCILRGELVKSSYLCVFVWFTVTCGTPKSMNVQRDFFLIKDWICLRATQNILTITWKDWKSVLCAFP